MIGSDKQCVSHPIVNAGCIGITLGKETDRVGIMTRLSVEATGETDEGSVMSLGGRIPDMTARQRRVHDIASRKRYSAQDNAQL